MKIVNESKKIYDDAIKLYKKSILLYRHSKRVHKHHQDKDPHHVKHCVDFVVNRHACQLLLKDLTKQINKLKHEIKAPKGHKIKIRKTKKKAKKTKKKKR